MKTLGFSIVVLLSFVHLSSAVLFFGAAGLVRAGSHALQVPYGKKPVPKERIEQAGSLANQSDHATAQAVFLLLTALGYLLLLYCLVRRFAVLLMFCLLLLNQLLWLRHSASFVRNTSIFCLCLLGVLFFVLLQEKDWKKSFKALALFDSSLHHKERSNTDKKH